MNNPATSRPPAPAGGRAARPPRRAAVPAACVLTAMVAGAGAVSDPALDGAFTAARQTVSVPGMAGAALTTDVFFPAQAGLVDPAAAPCPVVVLGHGFLQSRERHRNQGLHLASRGYIVLIPDFNAASDHGRNADELRKCIDWIEARHADAGSIFCGAVATGRIGATGHSAGGLSAIVAAARDRRIRALAPMDPVDSGGIGAAALAGVAVPLAITHSEPSACNAGGSAEQLYAAAGAPNRRVKVIGANHSDPQDPAGALSILTCGRPNPARQALYRRYVTGWFEYHLRDDARYGGWAFDLEGGTLAADVAAGTIDHAAASAPFAAWQAARFGPLAADPGVAGPAADPDRDAVVNLLEYAFNLDPLAAGGAGMPTGGVVEAGGRRHGAITFRRVAAAGDLVYQVQVSGDLAGWLGGSSYGGAGSEPDTAVTTEVGRSGIGLEEITVRDDTPLDGARRRFLRLQVTLAAGGAG